MASAIATSAIHPASTNVGRRNKVCSTRLAAAWTGIRVDSRRRRIINNNAGKTTSVTVVAINMPPPAMIPSSVTPRNPLRVMAKNAAALVNPAVRMLGPAFSIAIVIASDRSTPRARSSS